jgi:membrane associated rhomboid family serine protease
MPRSTPTTLALPPFTGATRRLILILLAVFFADAVLSHIIPDAFYGLLHLHLSLVPYFVARGQIWQLLTYAFMPLSLIGTLFALLTLWFVGSMLEDFRSARWLYELFLTSAIAGALIASAFSFTHLLGLDDTTVYAGSWPAIYGLLVAVAVLMGEIEFLFLFIVRIKAKYLVAIYILIDIGTLLKSRNAFEALIELSGALAGFLYIRYAPRRGLAFGLTERWFALRNEYYRAKRRRAARKFEVYMSKQGREVHFDKEGKYIDPDKDPASRNGKDDKRWMN